MKISVLICYPVEDTDMDTIRRAGPIRFASCMDCGVRVVALERAIREAWQGERLVMPLCFSCSHKPKYRPALLDSPIIGCSDTDALDVQKFAATVRSPEGGFGIN